MLNDTEVRLFRKSAAREGQRRYGDSGLAGPPRAAAFEEGAVWGLSTIHIAARTVALSVEELRACAASDDPLVQAVARRAGG
jgi:hypothetical protein